MPIQDMTRNMMRERISVTSSKEIDSKHELVNVAKESIHTETEFHAVPRNVRDLVTFAVNGENDIPSSSVNPGRSAERWCRLALLRSGDVETNPGPHRARSRGG